MFGLFEKRLPESERVALYKEALEREQNGRNRILHEADSYRTVMRSEVAHNKALAARIEAARAALAGDTPDVAAALAALNGEV